MSYINTRIKSSDFNFREKKSKVKNLVEPLSKPVIIQRARTYLNLKFNIKLELILHGLSFFF